MNTINPSINFSLDKILCYDITNIYASDFINNITIEFTSGLDGTTLLWQFCNIIFLKTSKHFKSMDQEGIGNIYISQSIDYGKSLLEILDYQLLSQSGEKLTSSMQPIYFQLDGSICIDIVCGYYNICIAPE